jgi:hypothetical protein
MHILCFQTKLIVAEAPYKSRNARCKDYENSNKINQLVEVIVFIKRAAQGSSRRLSFCYG